MLLSEAAAYVAHSGRQCQHRTAVLSCQSWGCPAAVELSPALPLLMSKLGMV